MADPYLRHEAEWAREKELECLRRAEHLRDPAWVARRLRAIERSRESLLKQFRSWWELATEELMLRDDWDREAAAAAADRDAAHWAGLAKGASERLAQKDEEALL